MHKVIVSLVAAGSVLLAPFAHAETISGVVDSIDADGLILILEDGGEYVMPPELDVPELELGDSVTIEFSIVDDANVISEITLTE